MDLRRLVGSVNQLRFNDKQGEVSFFGQKMIILRRDVFRVMREGLERLVGEQAAPFLSYLASGIGIHEGSIFRDSVKSAGESERASLENLLHSAFEDTNLGLGKIKVSTLDFDKGTSNVMISHCFEALENGPSESANCMFTSGFLAGLFAEVLDKTVQAREVRCISRGDLECEFQISPAEGTEEHDGGEMEPVEASRPSMPALVVDDGGLEPERDGKTSTEPKPMAADSPPMKTETKPNDTSRKELEAGVEKASRIAKRKQGFWNRLFK